MLKRIIHGLTPPIVMDMRRRMLGHPNGPSTTVGEMADKRAEEFEFIDFWSNTSLFALETIQAHGRLSDMRLLSIGNRMAHLADYVALFGAIYHSTLLETVVPERSDGRSRKLEILIGDFFELPKLDVDCVVSQGAIHCLNDTRYGNQGTDFGWQRPYQAAAKLRQILPEKPIPIVISIAVHRTESLIDDNARLAHDRFVQSFLTEGFSLQQHFFDYLCYGMPAREEYLTPPYRRAKELPDDKEAPNAYNYVIGNYYFL